MPVVLAAAAAERWLNPVEKVGKRPRENYCMNFKCNMAPHNVKLLTIKSKFPNP